MSEMWTTILSYFLHSAIDLIFWVFLIFLAIGGVGNFLGDLAEYRRKK